MPGTSRQTISWYRPPRSRQVGEAEALLPQAAPTHVTSPHPWLTPSRRNLAAIKRATQQRDRDSNVTPYASEARHAGSISWNTHSIAGGNQVCCLMGSGSLLWM